MADDDDYDLEALYGPDQSSDLIEFVTREEEPRTGVKLWRASSLYPCHLAIITANNVGIYECPFPDEHGVVWFTSLVESSTIRARYKETTWEESFKRRM